MRYFLSILFISMLLLGNNSLIAQQKEIEKQSLIWHCYFQTIGIKEKLYWVTEFQERHYINPCAQHQIVLRGHLHKTLKNTGWELATGLALSLQKPHDPLSTNRLTTPELRPHIETSYKQKLKHLSFDHRYRMEARFFHHTNSDKTELEDGYGFTNFRMRYRIQVAIPILTIKKTKTLSLKMSDEIIINIGDNIIQNTFDHNQFYLGLNMDVIKNISVDIGYLNFFQERSNASYYNRHILRYAINQKINLYKRKQ